MPCLFFCYKENLLIPFRIKRWIFFQPRIDNGEHYCRQSQTCKIGDRLSVNDAVEALKLAQYDQQRQENEPLPAERKDKAGDRFAHSLKRKVKGEHNAEERS